MKGAAMLRVYLAWLVLVGVLVACTGDEEAVPPPEPGQPTPVVNTVEAPPTLIPTRVVTRTPAPTQPVFATPTPTLNATLAPYTGEWALSLRYEIEGAGFADRVVYATSATARMDITGLVFGNGTFSASVTDSECVYVPNSLDGFGFTLSWTIDQTIAPPLAELRLQPADPTTPETYTQRCFDALTGEAREQIIEQQLLWPVLSAADWLVFEIEVLPGGARRAELRADVSQVTGVLGATMTGEILLSR
jgi:hypothetical protein